jgi:hypothetical protein
VKLVLSLVVALSVAFASHAAAQTIVFSTATDPDVRCDPTGVVVGWQIDAGLGSVSSATVSGIDPECAGAELYLQVTQSGVAAADGVLTLTAAHVGPNSAAVPFTQPGGSTAPVVLAAQAITGVSVLIHRGSQPATGTADNPCELIGMRIEGWGVDLLSAMVSSVRLTGISSACIGNEVVLRLDQNGAVIADARALLTAGNTGANVLTLGLTAPGAASTPLSLHASVITGISVSVEGEDGGGIDDVDAGPGTPVFTAPIPETPAQQPQQQLVDEVAGVQEQPQALPATGSGGLRSGGGSASLLLVTPLVLAMTTALVALILRRRVGMS